jgi:RimJ/RimL family protein N-acetyltransferase
MSSDLRTARLRLRRWRPDDRPPFARLNADPRVMEHFPSILTSEQSNALADLIELHFERHG